LKTKRLFWLVRGLGNGKEVRGTAPPKLSKWKEVELFVLL
jgi:hypothetical protein